MDRKLLNEEMPEINVEEFIKVVKTRRSIRKFTNKEIPENIIQSCLDLALLAPNSSNLQPWEFYIVRKNSPHKNKMAKACFGQNAAKTSSALIVIAARTKTWKRNTNILLENWPAEKIPFNVTKYYRKSIPMLFTQGYFSILGFLKSIITFFVGLKRAVPRWPMSNADMKTWAVKSTALAAQNLMLAFRAYGYDTCPMEGFDASKVKKIIKAPKDAQLVMILAAGERDTNGVYYPQMRLDRKLFIHDV